MSTGTFLRPSQVSALKQDLAAAEDSLTNPKIAPYIEDKTAKRRQAAELKAMIERDAPKPYVTTQEKDAAMHRKRELVETMKAGMLSHEEMRRNRIGSSSVHRHMQWEKANKGNIQEYKEICARLEPDSEDPELCSIEKFRPHQPFVMDTTAQIPGFHAMSPQAKENWPEEMSEPKSKTAISHLMQKVSETFSPKKEEEGV